MITPNDQDIIISMVGTEYAQDPPEDFVVEYGVRLGMMSRSGSSHNGIGPIALMHLLREFGVSPKKKPVIIAVSDWTRVNIGTRIMYQGRGGSYKGSSGEGMILISLDGYKGAREVPQKDVTLTKPLVDDVDDEVFKRDPDDAPPPRAALLEEAKKEPDALLEEWGEVEAGATVMAQWRGKEVEAEFVDIDGDNDVVVLINGSKRKLESSKVTIQSAEPA